ncbi:hypothetical protein Q0Z83_109600 [Actinoplanes sichuanensis]|nr:hypothetical protein Q0Z83_109600 [Actinoplanes sichuanensis]
MRWQSDHVERSRSLDDPPLGTIVVVSPDRIVYTEHWLRREGYHPRQTLHPVRPPAAPEIRPAPRAVPTAPEQP